MSKRHQAGFNMIELVILMVLVGILAVTALPKLTSAIGMRDDAWHDELQSALRFAQKGAVARRRLTCVAIGAATVTLTTALAHPATACDTAVTGPDGSNTFASSDNTSAGTSVLTLYFQPDGRVTSDALGNSVTNPTITMNGAASIVVYGDTGYVN